MKEIEGYSVVEQPEVGDVPITQLPGGYKMKGTAPNIGSDTKDIMLDYGYSLDEIRLFNREKIVFVPGLSG